MTAIARRRLLLIPLALASILALSGAAHAAPSAARHVVFQVSEANPQSWNLTLNNAHNVQAQLGPQARIEIVAYGPGIRMLKLESPVAARIAEALGDHVQVNACQATMKAQQLTQADMLPGIGYVPSGVVELMKKQSEGYAYIRP
ncbi:MAG: DsrE family protein [Burkholderiales bacterium]|nr:DsrE family protein [Burkholderiales bacterium]MDE1925742.1 DsrE family protein [Burkholderiales bacterium]MDE2157990.1 DsrE family protein [Burkholderiales bacterium]MDE2502578.1 DsrE family protein [Burkholderiales bacterium]